MEHAFKAGEDACGVRLDKFLALKLASLSRNKLHELIAKGQVFVNSKAQKPSLKLKGNEEIRVIEDDPPAGILPFDLDIKIIYEDDSVIVIDKPYGLTVHPANKNMHNTLVNALVGKNKALSLVDPNRPGVVHRLDKETSGLMVLACSNEAHYNLVNQFRERKVDKTYQAIVWGVLPQETMSVDMPLGRDKANRTKMKIGFIGSKDARTDVKVLKRFKDSTYVELKIHTGRMHQIRVHMKFLGYPVVGDLKYGPRKSEYTEMLLHAVKLGFLHPKTGKHLEFTSALPQRFFDFIEKAKGRP
jgi:23S rRNA pseudouridine1911/1915/1917 synthase